MEFTVYWNDRENDRTAEIKVEASTAIQAYRVASEQLSSHPFFSRFDIEGVKGPGGKYLNADFMHKFSN